MPTHEHSFLRAQWLRRLGLTLLLAATSAASVAGNPSSVVQPHGVLAPDFALPAISNETGILALSELRGKVTYVDFWASWCGPCRLSLPAIDGIYQDLKTQGFIAIAVSVDVVDDDALDFLKRYTVSYPVVIDTEGTVPKDYAVQGIPSGYLIDRGGMIREVHAGFKKGDELKLRASIEALLAEND